MIMKKLHVQILILVEYLYEDLLEEYGPEIECIKGEKTIVTGALSIFPLNGNQDTTQKSTYKKEIVPEINYNEEIHEGNFPINLKLIRKNQWKNPSLLTKYEEGTYQTGHLAEKVRYILTL